MAAHAHGPGGHTHDTADPALLSTHDGMRAIAWSFGILTATALVQVAIVWFTRSAALLADTIHNFGDAATAAPLWLAFAFMRRPATRRFPYGYGRIEDLAGLFVFVLIVASAAGAAYVSVDRFLNPQTVTHLPYLVAGGIIGFLGNEAAAQWRIRAGRRIGSAALIADGQHARIDGYTSLAVVAGAIGVWAGYPLADPIVGIILTVLIARMAWQVGKSIFARLLDSIEPETLDQIAALARQIPGVVEVTDVRARWLGHRVTAELNVAVPTTWSVEQAHAAATAIQERLLAELPNLVRATVHMDPQNASGEKHHPVQRGGPRARHAHGEDDHAHPNGHKHDGQGHAH
ncbi:MAG: cation diffusion facilitator family transporter [Thermoplasmatota archaeon]